METKEKVEDGKNAVENMIEEVDVIKPKVEDCKNAGENMIEVDVIKPLQPFLKYITWDYSDAEFFLKIVRGHKIMLPEEENKAMVQMLQSFCDSQILVSEGKKI